jgi:hypothetical protein
MKLVFGGSAWNVAGTQGMSGALSCGVEVPVRIQPQDSEPATASRTAFLRALPPGSRTKAGIDRQLAAERDSWT